MGEVGGLDGRGRDGPVVITRDEIIALVVPSRPARPSVLLVLGPFPWWIDDRPATRCPCSPFFSNCCRFGLCFDLRIAGRSGGVAPLLGIHARRDLPQ